MSDLANVHLRQAKSFLQAGDPQKAIDLLERAKALARDDREVLANVLRTLIDAYDAAGRDEQADRCRHQLGRLTGGYVPRMLTGDVRPIPMGGQRRRWISTLASAAVLILAIGVAGLVWWIVSRPVQIVQSDGGAAGTGAPTSRPSTQPVAQATPTTVPVVQVSPVIVPTTVPAPSPVAAKVDRQQLLKENVGLLVVLVRYEGSVQGRHTRIDVPLGTGTAFAVHPSGIMLTNRHVLEAGGMAEVPVTLEDSGMPTMILRGTSYLVCFGADAADRCEAKLLHKSQNFDMSILKVDRRFDNPLPIARQPMRQGDDVVVCGFPGVVQAALNKAASTPQRIRQVTAKWRQTGVVDPLDTFSPDSFNSTLTKGIVSAAERNIERDGRRAGYLQTDATIGPGNSGGPVLSSTNEVVGIATFLVKGEANLGVYHFALLMEQLKDELAPYMR